MHICCLLMSAFESRSYIRNFNPESHWHSKGQSQSLFYCCSVISIRLSWFSFSSSMPFIFFTYRSRTNVTTAIPNNTNAAITMFSPIPFSMLVKLIVSLSLGNMKFLKIPESSLKALLTMASKPARHIPKKRGISEITKNSLWNRLLTKHIKFHYV